jgi:predicted TIM-barrel fold metal-dependent hydrolase
MRPFLNSLGYHSSLPLALLFISCLTVKGQTHYQGPIIDMHVHVAVLPGERNTLGAPHAIDDILPLLKPNNVSNAGIITIAHAGVMDETRARNDSILMLHDRYAMLIPICSVHPFDTSAAWDEMTRLQKRGVRILKLHPNAQHFDVSSPQVAALAEKAGTLHMTLLFDSYNPEDASELGKLMMLAINHPDTKFILAHMGFVHFSELSTINVWKKYSWYRNNIYMDVSAISPMMGDSPFREQIVWLIRQIGVRQFLYGSDFPLFTFEQSIASVKKMGFTLAEEQAIFHDNALRLLDDR